MFNLPKATKRQREEATKGRGGAKAARPAPIAAPLYERQRRYERRQAAAVAEIGTLPPVRNPERREACRLDLHRFLADYFPASTGLSPFSDDHRRVIARIQQCILEGGLFCQAVFRGFAKTTISQNAAIWAAIYGHRRFVPIFGSDAVAAGNNIDSIKLELAENERLSEDFPEVCHSIRALEGKPQRCASQTYKGELTHIGWTADMIVLPTVRVQGSGFKVQKKKARPATSNFSPASGCIIASRGILGGSRGMTHKRPDGTQQRPDFVIIDDPQTDESARTPLQVAKRLDVIRKSILKLGGHARRMAVVVNATVIRRGDMVEQLLDPKVFPAWQGERVKMVRAWGPSHDTLWLGDYARLRNTFDPHTLGDQQRAHREATEFYRRNRAAMDAGCLVSWDHCYDHDLELSAIQHAYNALIDDGPEVFASECQNEPLVETQEGAEDRPQASEIGGRLTGLERGAVPAEASRVVAFIDVQKDLLFWTAAAFGDDFSGSFLDYGTWPDQGRTYFSARDARRTLAAVTKIDSLEGSLYAGLTALVGTLMSREWKRADGAVLRCEKLLIDANWGDSTDVVKQFCRESPHGATVLPSHGRYVGAKSRRFGEYAAKPGDRLGLNWRIAAVTTRGMVRHVGWDTNFWKSFLHSRLRTPPGQRGCLRLFGSDPSIHRLFSDHLCAEIPVSVEAMGRTVTEWTLPPAKPDNHWLDCAVGCCVAASIQGASIGEAKARPVKQVKLSEMQKTARVWRPQK
jgi:hypothetical protein